MSVFHNNILGGAAGQSSGGAAAGDYQIDRSLRFNDADTAFLSRTPSSASSGNTKATYSVWVKGADASDKTPLFSASSSGGSESIEHRNDGTLAVFFDEWVDGAYYTTAKFRDPSAWYHFVFAIDTTLATAADRVKIYVNGVQVSTTTSPALQQNFSFTGINQQNKAQYIGRTANTSGGTHHYASALFAEIHMIDGQALAPTDFGETDDNNNWNPKAYSGSYGTNGFYLDFSDNSSNSALGEDSSGNDNDWTVNNLVATAGLDGAAGFDAITYSGNSGTQVIGGPVYSNGWSGSVDSTNGAAASFDGNSGTYTRSGVNASCTWTAPSSIAFTTLKIRGARDSGNGTIEVNGVDVSSQFTSSSATLNTQTITGVTSPLTSIKLTGNASSQPRVAFVEIDGTVLEDGTNEPLKFQPDLVWIKNRDSNSYGHRLVDSVRGSTKYLMSHNKGAEATDLNGVTSFNSDGFTVGSSSDYNVSGDNNDFIAWAWKAGGAAVSNNSGSIPATVSANNTHGFSIVKYEGTGVNGTVAHGLSTAPKFFFGRNLDDTGGSLDWIIYHESLGNTGRLKFDTTTTSTSSTFFQNTSPSNSVITIGTSNDINKDNDDYILYCWSEVSGFSKFGSYSGASTGARTITTGFKPAFVLIKSYNTGSNWHLLDSKRGSKWLEANGAAAENGNSNISITYTDSGFTVDGSNVNASNASYIYAAFADTPDTSGVDSLIDTPTNADADSGNNIGNYCTLNPINNPNGDTFSDGNLKVVTSTGNYGTYTSTMATPLSGKWYAEVTLTAGDPAYAVVGLAAADNTFTSSSWLGSLDGVGYYAPSGNKIVDTSSTSYGATYGVNDTIGIAYDADNGTVTFYKNGASQGTISSVSVREYYFAGTDYDSGKTVTFVWNFGASGFFKYAPPAGHKALCTQNLPDPTIADGSTAFDVDAYTGNGGTQERSEFSFEPDLVWIKARSATYNHYLVDQVRGFNVSNARVLQPNLTNAEESAAGIGDSFASFDNDGFTVKQGTGNWYGTNQNNVTYVAWAWDAGSTTVTNTNGTITSSVRANTSAGFSMCTYTSPNSSSDQSFGHGLNAKPDFVIVKNRDSSYNYDIYHSSLGYNASLIFTDAATRSGAFSAEPTSTVVNTKHDYTHVNTDDYIAYCWTAVEGYSAFGSYTGNGSADGPFVFTGFRPRFLLYKRTDSADTVGWILTDSERNTYNVIDDYLSPTTGSEEGTTDIVDFLSNGFKMRIAGADGNVSSGTYVYAAFAEHPFKTARAR